MLAHLKTYVTLVTMKVILKELVGVQIKDLTTAGQGISYAKVLFTYF